jgi:hypothetical protein
MNSTNAPWTQLKTVYTNEEFELLKHAKDEFKGCELAVQVRENPWVVEHNNTYRLQLSTIDPPEPTWQINRMFVEQLPDGNWKIVTKKFPPSERELLHPIFALELLLARKRITELEKRIAELNEAVYYACDGAAYIQSKTSFEHTLHQESDND